MKAAYGERIRFSVVEFAAKSRVLAGWTPDPDDFARGLAKLTPTTEGSEPSGALIELGRLAEQARGGARVAGVLYTDGLFGCDRCPETRDDSDAAVTAALRLRESGVELYSVARPGTETTPMMGEITGSPDRSYQPAETAELARSFLEIAMSLSGIAGRGGVLTERLDGRYFEAPIAGTEWQLDRRGRLRLELGTLPALASTFSHPIRPLSAGVWQVGTEPASLYFVDNGQQVVEIQGRHRPVVLVLGWWTGLFWLVPPLGWMLARGLLERREPEPEPLPTLSQLPEPAPPLPFPRASPPTGCEAVPTLFLGLDDLGRTALGCIGSALDAVGSPHPFLLRHLDGAQSLADQRLSAEACFDSLVRLPAPAVERQVVLLGSSRAGSGCGGVVELARLFAHFAREGQEELRCGLRPDVIAIVLEDRAAFAGSDGARLQAELPGGEVRAGRIFRISGPDASSVTAGCGRLAALLVRPKARARVLDEAMSVPVRL